MKNSIFILTLFLTISCNKSDPGSTKATPPAPLDTNCPVSFLGPFDHCISKEGTFYVSSIADTADGYKVIRLLNGTRDVLLQVNCDSNTFLIPTQNVVRVNTSHKIYGMGAIYSNMIVINYSLFRNIDGTGLWDDGYSDTLRR